MPLIRSFGRIYDWIPQRHRRLRICEGWKGFRSLRAILFCFSFVLVPFLIVEFGIAFFSECLFLWDIYFGGQFTCLFVYLSDCLLVLFGYLSDIMFVFLCLSVCLLVYLSSCLLALSCLPVTISVFLFLSASIFLSVCLPLPKQNTKTLTYTITKKNK